MGRWKERLERLGRANEEARSRALRSLTLETAARVLEGILRSMPYPPPDARATDGDLGRRVSLGRLLRPRA